MENETEMWGSYFYKPVKWEREGIQDKFEHVFKIQTDSDSDRNESKTWPKMKKRTNVVRKRYYPNRKEIGKVEFSIIRKGRRRMYVGYKVKETSKNNDKKNFQIQFKVKKEM